MVYLSLSSQIGHVESCHFLLEWFPVSWEIKTAVASRCLDEITGAKVVNFLIIFREHWYALLFVFNVTGRFLEHFKQQKKTLEPNLYVGSQELTIDSSDTKSFPKNRGLHNERDASGIQEMQ